MKPGVFPDARHDFQQLPVIVQAHCICYYVSYMCIIYGEKEMKHYKKLTIKI